MPKYLFLPGVFLILAWVRPSAAQYTTQKPIIQSGGVVNSASFVNAATVAPQMLISIFGQNLATSTEGATATPLPFTLGGAIVTLNGVAAPLLYASSTQINLQVPSAMGGPAGGPVNVVVTTTAGDSDPVPINVTTRQLGVFTLTQTGCGQLAAFNIHGDGSITLNGPQNSFDPVNDLGLTIYLTGLGAFSDRLDGVPWVYNAADNQLAQNFQVMFGSPSTQQVTRMSLNYLGPAPFTTGGDQVNAVGQWSGAPRGCKVPMYLTDFSTSASQLVDVSIQAGGGTCADSADDTMGIVTFQHTLVSDTSGTTSTEGIHAQLFDANGLGFGSPAPAGFVECCAATAQPPVCADSLPSALDAGSLTVNGPGVSALVLTPPYQADVPSGTITGGSYQIAGAGGAQVGAFSAQAQVPAPISITTSLAPGTQAIGSNGGLTVKWTGGDDSSMVYVQLIVHNANYTGAGFQAANSALGSLGSVSISGTICVPFFFCSPVPSGTAEVIVTQSPVPLSPATSPIQPFSAPGLALGGEVLWKYVFDYKGLVN